MLHDYNHGIYFDPRFYLFMIIMITMIIIMTETPQLINFRNSGRAQNVELVGNSKAVVHNLSADARAT